MGATEFVAGVDRLLTRAHELFRAGGEGGQLATSGGGSVPGAPEGVSGVRGGVSRVAGSYEKAQTSAAGLDEELLACLHFPDCGPNKVPSGKGE
jgi:hypothetical protein